MGKDLKGRDLGVGITQRPDGRYEARATVKGQKIDIYNTDLKQLKIDFEVAKETARQELFVCSSVMTVDEWFMEWFDRYRKPQLKESSIPPTLRKYESIMKPFIGALPLTEVRNIHIQKAINEAVSNGRAISTVKDVTGLMRSCFDSARNNMLIKVNPAFEVCMPVTDGRKQMRRFLDESELKEFLEEAEFSYYKEVYYIMLYTGMRIGEVGALEWKNIDTKARVTTIEKSLMTQYYDGKKVVKVTTPKTVNSYRKIPFIGDIEEYYKSWRKKQEKAKKLLGSRWRSTDIGYDLALTTSLGSPITRYVLERDLNNIVANINSKRMEEARRSGNPYIEMEKIYPHALRHTFCSRCFSAGMEPKVVQMLMGHANYSTTIDIYTHVTQKDLKDEMGKFSLYQVEDSGDIQESISKAKLDKFL